MLWDSRRRTGWRAIKASKIVGSYTGHKEAAPFKAQARHNVFPLDAGARRHDEWMAQQQTQLGAAARAVCLALTKVNEAADRLSSSSGQPSAVQSEVGSSVFDLLAKEVVTPLGHALQVLSSECSSLCRDRRQLCLNTMLEGQGRTEMDRIPTSSTDLFSGDVDATIMCIGRRHDARGAFKHSGQRKRPQPSQTSHNQVNQTQTKRPRQDEAGPRFNQPFRGQPSGAGTRGGRHSYRGRGYQGGKQSASGQGNKQ